MNAYIIRFSNKPNQLILRNDIFDVQKMLKSSGQEFVEIRKFENYKKLRGIGLTDDQCLAVYDLTNNL